MISVLWSSNKKRPDQPGTTGTTWCQIWQFKNSATMESVCAATGMIYMPSIRKLVWLNETGLLKKDFKIREVISNARQNDWLSFVSLSHQLNDGRRARYSEKEIMVGVNHKEHLVTFVKSMLQTVGKSDRNKPYQRRNLLHVFWEIRTFAY